MVGRWQVCEAGGAVRLFALAVFEEQRLARDQCKDMVRVALGCSCVGNIGSQGAKHVVVGS